MRFPEIKAKQRYIVPECRADQKLVVCPSTKIGSAAALSRSPTNEVMRHERTSDENACVLSGFRWGLVPSIGQAQVMVEMPLVTCAQYLAMPPEQSSIFAAWMSGWYNQKMGYTYIDIQAYERNVAREVFPRR